MGIGIEEIFEFTDTSGEDIDAHINRQKARFWRLGKFENKYTFLLVYINCYGLEDGPKVQLVSPTCTNLEIGK